MNMNMIAKKETSNFKKSNKSSTYNRKDVQHPDVINMDALSCYDDESLERAHAYLQNEREKASRYTDDLTSWEVEICYVQRELKIRNTRRSMHSEYLRNNPDAYYGDFSSSHDEAEQSSYN
jgi:hypothetical protein